MPEQSKYHKSEDQLANEAQDVATAKKDPKAFEVLYNRYYEQIFRYLYKRLDDKQEAFDLTSEVFLKAMMNLYRFEFKGVPFSSWLYRIAFNELNQAFRSNKVKRTINIESTNVHTMIEEMEEETEEEIEIPEDILLSLRIDGLLEINSMQASSILSDFKNTLACCRRELPSSFTS